MPPTDTETAEARALPHIPGFVLLTELDGAPVAIRVSAITAISCDSDGDVWVRHNGDRGAVKGTFAAVAAAIARATTGEAV